MHPCFARCARAIGFAGSILVSGSLCGAEDIKPYRAQEVQPYHAEPVRPHNAQQPDGHATTRQQGRLSVAALKCTVGRCEVISDTNAPIIVVSGVDRAAGGNAVAQVVVFDENKQFVRKEAVGISSDGSFRANVLVSELPPGTYMLGVIAPGQQDRAIAAGSFTVAAEPAGTANAEHRGFRAVLDRLNENAAARNGDNVAPNKPTESAGRSSLFGTLGLAIPGVVYSTDNYATNTRTTTIASGVVTKSAVRVNPDGTYIWNSAWDGRIVRGNWRKDGGALILSNGQSGHDWRFERLPQAQGKAVVVLYDSSTWYHGTPID